MFFFTPKSVWTVLKSFYNEESCDAHHCATQKKQFKKKNILQTFRTKRKKNNNLFSLKEGHFEQVSKGRHLRINPTW